MSLKNKWVGMISVIATVLLLGACANTGELGEASGNDYDNPRNHEAEDLTTLSDGLDKHPVWFVTDAAPGRTSTVNSVFVFKDGYVQNYTNFQGLQIEELDGFSDDELIQHVTEKAATKEEGKYSLDITLDATGQYTEKIDVLMHGGVRSSGLELESRWYESGLATKEDYLKSIEGDDRYSVSGDMVFITDAIEDDKSLFTIYPDVSSQKIFDTTYSGLRIDDDYGVFTRVDDGFAGFVLDDPKTDKINVTVDGE